MLRDGEKRRQELYAQRHTVEEQIRVALNQPQAAPTELSRLIAQANEIDEQLALNAEHTIRAVQQMLNIQQQAKLILVRHELQQQVRQVIRQRLEPERERVR